MIESTNGNTIGGSFADRANVVETEIVLNEAIARDTYRLRFAAPGIAESITPGQFVMVRIAGCDDPLIGRAFALYDIVRDAAGNATDGMDVVYLVKGKFTKRLSTLLPGQKVQVWGPLGNGFGTAPCEHLIVAAGGVGITPFVAVTREALGQSPYANLKDRMGYAKRVTVIYGARSAQYVAGEQDFIDAGAEFICCTDDGSRGSPLRVPDQLAQYAADQRIDVQGTRILTCGPEIMMQKVSQWALERGFACEASLETPMACGIGICFSCVTKVRQSDGSWDYKRTCVEGPVFDASDLVW